MSLFRQIILAVLVLFLVVFGGNAYLNISNSRSLVAEQMQVHAQDTATSLAVSVSQAVGAGDQATVETLLNTIADSGYFQQIRFTNLTGEVQLEKSYDVSIQGVPGWFVRWADFPKYQGLAQVSAGWEQFGNLVVVSHPGKAYLRLWQTTKSQLVWCLAMVILACVIVYAALRWILAPLKRLEQQATAISNGEFKVQPDLPKPRELSSVVVAMNTMSQKLDQLFGEQVFLISQLRKQASIDDVTGLANRADFDARIASLVADESGTHSVLLIIISIQGLVEINHLGGREKGNQLLVSVADILRGRLKEYPDALLARRQGTEFSILIRDIRREESSPVALKLFDAVRSIGWSDPGKTSPSFNMGYVHEQALEDVSQLLSSVDIALKKAIQTGRNMYQNFAAIVDGEVPVLTTPAYDWQELLESIIEQRSVQMYYQPVFSTDDKKLMAHEIFARFPCDDELLTASTLIPVAERLGLVKDIDKMILTKLAEQFADTPFAVPVRVNLSAYTLRDEYFAGWLEDFLAQHKAFATHLILELDERTIIGEPEAVSALSTVLQKWQVGLCIDQFGLDSATFSRMTGASFDSIKIHRSFVADLKENQQNRFYISSLISMAQNLGLQVLAQGVESESAWTCLKQLGVDGAQGYHLGAPAEQPLHDAD